MECFLYAQHDTVLIRVVIRANFRAMVGVRVS